MKPVVFVRLMFWSPVAWFFLELPIVNFLQHTVVIISNILHLFKFLIHQTSRFFFSLTAISIVTVSWRCIYDGVDTVQPRPKAADLQRWPPCSPLWTSTGVVSGTVAAAESAPGPGTCCSPADRRTAAAAALTAMTTPMLKTCCTPRRRRRRQRWQLAAAQHHERRHSDTLTTHKLS